MWVAIQPSNFSFICSLLRKNSLKLFLPISSLPINHFKTLLLNTFDTLHGVSKEEWKGVVFQLSVHIFQMHFFLILFTLLHITNSYCRYKSTASKQRESQIGYIAE
jgi:hypothetical protein